jgi:hypothetical protein
MDKVPENDAMHPDDFAGLIVGLKCVTAYALGEREGFVTHIDEARASGISTDTMDPIQARPCGKRS